MRICKRLNAPIVARGAGTGLSGGAMPHSQGVLLGLSKFNRIKHIDLASATAIVQPGVRNLAISEAASPYGLYYAPDPSSQIACSIGGNVAENSGGVHCLKYGLTVHNVLRVRVVTIDGDVVELGSEAPDAPGLDLLSVFIGSEGMLGVGHRGYGQADSQAGLRAGRDGQFFQRRGSRQRGHAGDRGRHDPRRA